MFPQLLLTSENVEKKTGLIRIWNIDTATKLHTYKTNKVAWNFDGRESETLSFVTPGRLTALAASFSGVFIVAASANEIFVWLAYTGQLLCSFKHHYQPVTKIRFTDDDSFLVTAGDDGNVFVYSFAKLVSMPTKNTSATVATTLTGEARHAPWLSLNGAHSLPISDVYVTSGGAHARLLTCSTDSTCKLWALAAGGSGDGDDDEDGNSSQCLLSVRFPVALSSCCMDASECALFCGGHDGVIYQASLSAERSFDHVGTLSVSGAINNGETSDQSECFHEFVGHESDKKVTFVASVCDGSKLVSAGEDGTARVWHVAGRQCLHVLSHVGPISCALLIAAPPPHLAPHLSGGLNDTAQHVGCLNLGSSDNSSRVDVWRQPKLLRREPNERSSNELCVPIRFYARPKPPAVESSSPDLTSVTNGKLYQFCLKRLLMTE